MTGGTQACCDGWSCTLIPVPQDLSRLLQPSVVHEVRARIIFAVSAQAHTSLGLSINS